MVLPVLQGEPHDIIEEYSRGQRKRWSCWAADASEIDFPGAAQAAIIIRETFEASGDRVGKEMALVLTSQDARKITAAALNRHKRSHWGIENKSHYPRDVVYREDNGQTCRVMQNPAIASQLIAFRNLQEAGDTPSQIVDNGFSGR
jgi:hypothetical protein